MDVVMQGPAGTRVGGRAFEGYESKEAGPPLTAMPESAGLPGLVASWMRSMGHDALIVPGVVAGASGGRPVPADDGEGACVVVLRGTAVASFQLRDVGAMSQAGGWEQWGEPLGDLAVALASGASIVFYREPVVTGDGSDPALDQDAFRRRALRDAPVLWPGVTGGAAPSHCACPDSHGRDCAALVNLVGLAREQHARTQAEASCTALTDRLQVAAAQCTEALSASRAKSQALAHMCHEIRTPIASVLCALELIIEQGLAGEQAELARNAYEAAEGLLGVVNDALDLARIEAGRLEIAARSFDPRALLDAVGRMFDAPATARGMALSVTCAHEVPVGVVGDEQRVRQVLVNLVGNAVKYGTAGPVHVSLAWACGADGSALLFAVEDSGPGIPADVVPRLFTAYEQGLAAGSGSGSGLGLAICRRLVELMGGRIWVDSTYGRGSVFRFVVPSVAGITGRIDDQPETGSPDGLAGRDILLVEDNPVLRTTARRMLERLGCDVTEAADGGQALEQFVVGKHDVVLMDCGMPAPDGLETTAMLRAYESTRGPLGRYRSRLRILAFTASVMSDERQRILAAGFDDIVPKPWTLRSLAAGLHDALGRTPSTAVDHDASTSASSA